MIESLGHSSENMQIQIQTLEEKINVLQNELEQLRKSIPARIPLPDTKLLSDSFLERAFAVWGHSLVAGLIIAVPFYCLMFLIGR